MTKDEKRGCLLVGAAFAFAVSVLVIAFVIYTVSEAIRKNQPKNTQIEKRR